MFNQKICEMNKKKLKIGYIVAFIILILYLLATWSYRGVSRVTTLEYNPNVHLLGVGISSQLFCLPFVGRDREGDTLTVTPYSRIIFFARKELQVRMQYFEIPPDVKYIRTHNRIYKIEELPTIFYHRSRGKRMNNEIN